MGELLPFVIDTRLKTIFISYCLFYRYLKTYVKDLEIIEEMLHPVCEITERWTAIAPSRLRQRLF